MTDDNPQISVPRQMYQEAMEAREHRPVDPHTGMEREPRVAPRRPRMEVLFHDNRWTVNLDGRPIEDALAPDGLKIRAVKDVGDSMPRCVVELTFHDVELSADLRDVLLHYGTRTERGTFVESREVGPGAQSAFTDDGHLDNRPDPEPGDDNHDWEAER
jgi:hypothetical protein